MISRFFLKALGLIVFGLGCAAVGQAGYVRAEIVDSPALILGLLIGGAAVFFIVDTIEKYGRK